MAAATKPAPWLTLLAISSPADYMRLWRVVMLMEGSLCIAARFNRCDWTVNYSCRGPASAAAS
jgi:hypothetical protein